MVTDKDILRPDLLICVAGATNKDVLKFHGYFSFLRYLVGSLQDSDIISWAGQYGNFSAEEHKKTFEEISSQVTTTLLNSTEKWQWKNVFEMPY